MHVENLFAPEDVRIGHGHLAVETPGTQQCRIEHIGPVGSGDQDHALVGLEPVHFHQQLIEGLLAFVIAPAKSGAAVAPDSIYFVDEDDAGRIFLALFEHVAHAAGADADKHLDKVRTRYREERDIGLAGDGPGE